MCLSKTPTVMCVCVDIRNGTRELMNEKYFHCSTVHPQKFDTAIINKKTYLISSRVPSQTDGTFSILLQLENNNCLIGNNEEKLKNIRRNRRKRQQQIENESP